MKVFFAILLVSCATLAYGDEEWTPKTAAEIKVIRAECLKENQLSDELINKMKHFEFPDVEPVRKYLLCTAEKMDIFCTHEGYHPDRIAKQFRMDMEESEVLEIAKGCADKNEEGSPSDVWAFRGHKCLMSSKVGDKVKAFIKKRQEEAAKAAEAAQAANA